MRGLVSWGVGIVISLGFHAALFAFLDLSVDPDPVEQQPQPETRLDMAAYEVDRTEAKAQPADGDAAAETEAQGTGLAAGAIPVSKAAEAKAVTEVTEATTPDAFAATTLDASPPAQAALAPNVPVAAAIAATAQTTTAARPEAQTAAALSPQASSAPTLVLAAAPAAARPPVGTLAVAAFPEAAPAPEGQPQATLAAQRAPEAVTAAPRAPDALQAAPREPEALAALTQKPDAAALPQTETAAPAAPEVATETNPVASATLPSEKATASLAWSVGGKTVTDPVSLAAIQAFMQEGDLGSSASDAGEVRDDIAGLLAGVPCSRLQAAFIPETGKLELRGHVPENGLRGPVLAALQAQVGAEISVTDNLLILPRPQCGALSGISDVGLPQSTDQFTDARLIGNDAHAQEYRYSEGQRLEFDMQAPDYDGVFYVDFFDADGQVIHLVPNEVIPLTEQPAKSALNIGGDRRDGAPGLNITIGPPFGQEIAVAFAASVPLYEGLRPLVEPAEPYLVFLKEQVAEAREMHPDFKGEWVYFFITTSPATQ